MKPSRILLPALFAATIMGGAFVSGAEARPSHNGMGYGYGCNGGYDDACGCYGNGGGHRGHWGGYGYGNGLSPEQRAKYSALIDEYAPKMRPVRDQIFVKRQELAALRNAANPDVKAVRVAAEELVALQNQMTQLHRELGARLEKEVGAPEWPGKDKKLGKDKKPGKDMGAPQGPDGYPPCAPDGSPMPFHGNRHY